MFLFLLFSALYVDGENYAKIYRSSNEIDLFFVEKGFFNPALGAGIIGADINPATLGKMSDVEFFTAFSLPGVSEVGVNEFSVRIEDEEVSEEDTLFGPISGKYHALGGINFIGFGKRFGQFALGISYGAGYKLGIEASLSGNVYGSIQPDETFEFTNEDFSEIEAGDTVRVRPLFKGALTLDNPVPLRLQYSDFPIFLGAGYVFGPLGLGIGLKFQNCQILGEGGFATHIDSLVMEVRDTTVFDSDGDDWLIRNFSAALDFHEDLVTGEIYSEGLSAMHPVFNLGTIIDFPVMDIFLGFDLAKNYELKGGYRWDFSWVSEIPDSFIHVDTTTYMHNIHDSLISGRAIITIDSVIWDEESEIDNNARLTFSGSSFNFGFLIEPLNLGFSAKLAFPYADYYLNKIGLCTYVDLPVPVVDVRLGLAADCVFLTGSEVANLIFIPSATMGLTFSYQRDYLQFYLPIKYDVSHIASSIINKIVEDQEDVTFDMKSSSNLWDNLAFGFGFRVKI
jgi:hypothetical protein